MKNDNPYYDESMWKGAPNQGFSKARELRRKMTKAETLLWERLRSNQLKSRSVTIYNRTNGDV